MAHEVLTVCLGPDAHQDLDAAIGRALGPFDMEGDHEPYQGEWDQWWFPRGGGFTVVPGSEDDPRLVGMLRTAGEDPAPGEFAGGPRGLLDFRGMRSRAERLAATIRPGEHHLVPYAQWQVEWVVPTDHLLSLDGTWWHIRRTEMPPQVRSLDFANRYLDDLPPETMVVRLHLHC